MRKSRNAARYHVGLTLAVVGLMTIAQVLEPSAETHAQATTPTWTSAGNLHTARVFHTATLLPNGKLLVVGGITGLTVLNSAELYDPASGQWSVTGSLNVPRYLFTATLLRNGKVLVAGGASGPLSPTTDTAELYDPATGIWSATGNLNTTRTWHSAVMLRDGKVLIAGGWDGDSLLQTAEIYDPDTGRWTLTGKLKAARYGETATLLKDGTVLIAGGSDDGDLASTLASAELYDPATETWSLTGSLNLPRIFQTATLLPNGKVLVAGGYNLPPTSFNSAELYDPATGTWTFAGNLNAARSGHTATLLANGKVLVAGGIDWGQGSCLPSCRPSTLANAELYDVLTGTWSNTANLNFAREAHTATLLPNGKVVVVGGRIINSPLNSAELYDPGDSGSANAIDDPQFFVRQHYLDFLNREPDADGLAFWTNQITSCGGDLQCTDVKRINVSAAYFLSIEFQQTGYLVYRTYKAAYGNPPDAPVPIRFNEFLPDTQRIGGGVVVNQSGWETVLENNKQAFMTDFVQQSRFIAAYPSSITPDQFVDRLFANAGVTPLDTDRTAAINEFGGAFDASGTAARARALRRVAENSSFQQQEFNRAFVLMQYFGYLRRDPNSGPDNNFDGYNFWLNKLNGFNGNFVDAEMVKAFITSAEYRQRFAP